MLDKAALLARAVAWEKAHPPNTGYTEKVFREVCGANLPAGVCLLLQIAAQFTGKEEGAPIDLVYWDTSEKRTPYSNTYRMTFDRSVDCSSAWYILAHIFFGVSIGTWTEAQYDRLGEIGHKVPWAERREFDIVQYNFKSGRRVSHDSGIVRKPKPDGTGGLIAHTTSPTNPWRIEGDGYAAANRVCVWRFTTDAQYQSLFVDGGEEERDMFVFGDPRHVQVAHLQLLLVRLGYSLGTYQSIIDPTKHDGTDGDYGTATKTAMAKFQVDAGVKTENGGYADDVTLLALAEAAAAKLGVDPATLAALQAQVASLEGSLASDKTAFTQIATIANARK